MRNYFDVLAFDDAVAREVERQGGNRFYLELVIGADIREAIRQGRPEVDPETPLPMWQGMPVVEHPLMTDYKWCVRRRKEEAVKEAAREGIIGTEEDEGGVVRVTVALSLGEDVQVVEEVHAKGIDRIKNMLTQLKPLEEGDLVRNFNSGKRGSVLRQDSSGHVAWYSGDRVMIHLRKDLEKIAASEAEGES